MDIVGQRLPELNWEMPLKDFSYDSIENNKIQIVKENA